MPPPMHLARYGDYPPSEYAQAYASYGRVSPDRAYARQYPPPDYMTYEERRAFEDHHARGRLEGNYGSIGYMRTPSPDSLASYPPEMAGRLVRPTLQVSEHPAARRQAEMAGHPSMERAYAPRRSPPGGPDGLYPPSARVAERQAYEPDAWGGTPIAGVRRISDPYLRVPAATERHNSARTARVPQYDGRAAPVLPPMATSPHAVQRESASGLPMMPPRDAQDPLNRHYANTYGYPPHPDAAEVPESARPGSREEGVEHRRNLFRAAPASRPPGPPRP